MPSAIYSLPSLSAPSGSPVPPADPPVLSALRSSRSGHSQRAFGGCRSTWTFSNTTSGRLAYDSQSVGVVDLVSINVYAKECLGMEQN